MAHVRFRYALDTPPAPAALVDLIHPTDDARRAESRPGLIDTGADQTVIPIRLVDDLGLIQVGEVVVKGYDGSTQRRPTYLVRFAIHTFPPIDVTAIALDGVPNIIVGRDVLNRYTVTLKGRESMLEITDE
jgi:predicted aspartyl protease